MFTAKHKHNVAKEIVGSEFRILNKYTGQCRSDAAENKQNTEIILSCHGSLAEQNSDIRTRLS